MSLPDRLRAARLAADMSARNLDELAGLAQGHTALIESGRRGSPSVETVRKLADALGVSIDWLVNGDDDNHATA